MELLSHQMNFYKKLENLCNEKGILLIFDEIQAGLGRTGRLWACDHWNTAPDILCLAKGIAGGVPMGATLVRPDILASDITNGGRILQDISSRVEHQNTFFNQVPSRYLLTSNFISIPIMRPLPLNLSESWSVFLLIFLILL